MPVVWHVTGLCGCGGQLQVLQALQQQQQLLLLLLLLQQLQLRRVASSRRVSHQSSCRCGRTG